MILELIICNLMLTLLDGDVRCRCPVNSYVTYRSFIIFLAAVFVYSCKFLLFSMETHIRVTGSKRFKDRYTVNLCFVKHSELIIELFICYRVVCFCEHLLTNHPNSVDKDDDWYDK